LLTKIWTPHIEGSFRFGTEQRSSDAFHVPGSEWRIVWSYAPDAQLPELAVFNAVVYPKGERAAYIEFIMETGANQTSGTTYVNEGPGDFYVNVNVANAEAYTVVVEYDE
jgi:hypothetical protein